MSPVDAVSFLQVQKKGWLGANIVLLLLLLLIHIDNDSMRDFESFGSQPK
jgi:uncharacterized membrane protein